MNYIGSKKKLIPFLYEKITKNTKLNSEIPIFCKNAKWTFNKPKEIPYLRSSFTTSVVSGNERTIHPTQKSLELMRQLIKIHTNENEIILDMFLGSGTTGVASLLENRKFIGIELSKEYFDIAKARIEDIKKTQFSNK